MCKLTPKTIPVGPTRRGLGLRQTLPYHVRPKHMHNISSGLMRPIVTDALTFHGVCVCWSPSRPCPCTLQSAEPIEMPFWGVETSGPRAQANWKSSELSAAQFLIHHSCCRLRCCRVASVTLNFLNDKCPPRRGLFPTSFAPRWRRQWLLTV